MENGGDKIKLGKLLTMLILLNLVMACVNGIYATSEHQNLTNLGEYEQNLGNATSPTNINNSTNLTNLDNTTENIRDTKEPVEETGSKSQQVQNDTKNATISNSSTENIQEEPQAAAGETKTVNVNNITVDQIKEAAARVKSFIETNSRLPAYVHINNLQFKISDFLLLMTENVLQINRGIPKSLTLKDINAPKNSTGSFKSGTLTKTTYIDVTNRISQFINSNGVAPNYATTNLGKISYESLVYMYSKILSFYNTNNRLPNSVSMDSNVKILPPIVTPPEDMPEITHNFTDVRGIWLKAEDIGIVNLDELKNANITDVFIKANLISTPTYESVLNSILNKFQNSGIRIHAWITCFKDVNGNWVDPANTTQRTFLLNMVKDIVKNYNIDGIHLDYVRYSGVGDNAAYKHSNGTETITSFVRDVYNTVKSIKSKVAISAAVMPECSQNGHYYGQDYAKLAPYLDFIVPMIYKGNYNKNSSWIGTVTKYIAEQSNGKPVIAGLQTYVSDSDTTKISANELNQDVKSALSNGASGFVLFRYGLIDQDFLSPPSFTLSEIRDAGSRVKTYIETNKKLPSFVTIGTKQVSMPEFLKLMVNGVLQLNNGITNPIKLENILNPQESTGSFKTGSINLAEYLKLAQTIKSFIDSNGIAPNYSTTSLGNIQFEQLIYMYSKILNFQKENNRLPNTVSMDSSLKISSPVIEQQSIPSFTVEQIKKAAVNVKSYIETNKILPNYVLVGNIQVKMNDFLNLLVESLLQINMNVNTPITLKNITAPDEFTSNFANGDIMTTEYIDIAQRIKSFINSNSATPSYATTSLGKVSYEDLIYMYSKILSFYNSNNRLPSYVSMSSSNYIPIPIPTELEKYLQATKNCQVNDPRIISLSESITEGAITTYDKAVAIFNWVRDNLSYSFYYNTKYGAVNTLLKKEGNCVDHSHLLIALARAAGIPAKYEHGTCTFTSGTYGHVWAQLWVDGKWYNADAISYRNTFGVINNWNTNTMAKKGTYIELPF
ncbi:pseudomurein-binding repeat-containing protein [Methanobacterium sp.]|uniref:pseudomurein-binding repeat-containing protein n=1 Tax=Methanobacterium sp. TaxID=2164 RepID=UPI003C71F4A5